MEFLRKIWKLKQAKIALAVLCGVAVLTWAFFAAPGTGKIATAPTSSAVTVTEISTVDGVQSEESSSVVSEASSTEGKTLSVESTSSASSTASVAASKDKHETDTILSEKSNPVESEKVTANPDKKLTCTLSIRCDTILNNMNLLKPEKVSILPKDGTILQTMTITFNEGESVFDVLKRVTREKRIHMEFKDTPIYNSAYIQGINNLYEFDCGPLSGWMYKVNEWFPNYGVSRYKLKAGDVIEFIYTCDLGKDIGGGYAAGGG